MKLFLDTANIVEIQNAVQSGILDGVTTNPSLVSKEYQGKEFSKEIFKQHLSKICELVDGPVSVEIESSGSFDDMLDEALEYSTWHKHIIIKVPMTLDGLKLVKILSEKNIKTNVTLIFSANQALLAAKAGASMVSPFIGRLDDNGQDGIDLIREIVQIFENFKIKTEVLVASIRHARHITDSALIGANIATMPYIIFEKLHKHPMTDLGLATFEKDWQKIN